jgi:hypothetical protein
MAEGTNPRKMQLLRCLVKNVLVHDRLTVEVWYGLPNSSQVSRLENLALQGGLELPTLRLTVATGPNALLDTSYYQAMF